MFYLRRLRSITLHAIALGCLLHSTQLFSQAQQPSALAVIPFDTPFQVSAAPPALPLEIALPDAPEPGVGVNHTPIDTDSGSRPLLGADQGVSRGTPVHEEQPSGCEKCGENWGHLAIESALYLTFQNAGNVYTGYWYRWETTHGKWWHRYINSVDDWRWNRWSDDNPFLDDYVGHPFMGSLTDYLWIQNNRRDKMLVQANSAPYLKSRLKAFVFSTAYSMQWKFGPLGEASIGHNGDHFYYDKGQLTNETGWVELVTTPVGGGLWTLGEDALDQHVIRHLEEKSRDPLLLIAYQFLNPTRATANFLRFRPPWYRDTRTVKATSFWSDPGPESYSTRGAVEARRPWSPYGGVHEFGAWWGVSPVSGHIWGYADDIKFMPIDLRYSYLFSAHEHWAARYSPEVTALAMLDEPVPNGPDRYTQRKRTYGSGISPEGVQIDFLPQHRVQPFLSNDGGFIYFMDRVLSPQGSRFMLIVDFGGGVNIFHTAQQAVSVGYRYQHLSNANVSLHNPGTDANTFYVSISRFRTR